MWRHLGRRIDGRPLSLAGCEHALSSDDQAAYATAGVYGAISAEAFTDAHDRVWADQHGNPMTLAQHLEAACGVRGRRDSPFEADSGGELAVPQG